MPAAMTDLIRLARAGLVFAEHGVRFVPKGVEVPVALRLARAGARVVNWIGAPFRRRQPLRPGETPIAAALTRLGPSYIKLGQFLATRQDLVGSELAGDLAGLQDRMAPFPIAEARRTIEAELGRPVGELYAELGPPVAAASIAQVHKARVVDEAGERALAVKILRPGIERRFAEDLSSFGLAARTIERWHAPSRRLKPTSVVDTLAHSMEIELDLRMEAAAISEMADNVRSDPEFRVPRVDWPRTARRVLSLEWIDGIPIGDRERLEAAGFDVKRLGEEVIRSFLRHAMRDGFFHADMHQGNLFVDAEGRIVAVDFGIMGRLSPKERRFLAEILYGFITRDYRRAALAHFVAGYVPERHPVDVFAQALRAIGEPLMGRPAEEISMGHLLGQLFQYTEVFDMQTRPELILLQKTMVVVEGVARNLDPRLNIWTAAEPVVRQWMESEIGLEGRIKEAREGAGQVGTFLGDLPLMLLQVERSAGAFAEMGRSGVRLAPESLEAISDRKAGRWRALALWAIATALAALAVIEAGRLWG